jgi:Leucine-rich repeat (LRR) protein
MQNLRFFFVRIILVFSVLIIYTNGDCSCSFEKSSTHYGCRLLMQNLISESDMELITGTHWSNYEDQNVTALWATNSVVKIFPSAFPVKFPNLDYIYLSNTSFEALNEPFDNCENINWIVITKNLIAQVPDGVFVKCAKLGILSLSENKITRVDKEAFTGLTELKSLYLQSNAIVEFEKDVFKQLLKLEYINLSDNNIKNLPMEIFLPLTELAVLEIKNNGISVIDKNLFTTNTKISELNLEGNKLDILEADVFKNLKSLKILLLQSNFISRLPTFTSLESLEKLDLSSNMMLVVKFNFFGMPNLKQLILNNNQITMDSDFLQLSGNFTKLSMANNSIRSIDDSAFLNLNNLQSLDLSNNLLTELKEQTFKGLNSLIKLDLSYNEIVKIDREMFKNLLKLNELDMRNNKCANKGIIVSESIEDVINENLAECVNHSNVIQSSMMVLVSAVMISLFKFL